MRLFYIISAALVVGLSLMPLWLLETPGVSQFEEMTFPDGQGGRRRAIVSYGAYGAKIKSVDPATCGDTSSAGIQGYFYESLYSYHFLLRPVQLEPELAQSMPQVSADNLVYTIPIRRGVKYHRNPCFGVDGDGRPLTREVKAQDFVLGIKRIADYHITTQLALAFIEDRIVGIQDYRERTRAYAKGDFSRYDLPLAGVRAVDDYTLEIRLSRPFPQLVYVLALNNFAPIPRELVDYWLASQPDGRGGREPIEPHLRNPEITTREAIIGTGAYCLAEWVYANKIVLVRNEDYREVLYPSHGEPGDREAGLLDDAGKPTPFIDVFYLTYVEETNPMWMMFLARRLDSVAIPRELYSQVISPDQKLQAEWARKGIRLHKYSDPAIYWYAFNMDDPVVGKSKSLRQALSLAYDVQEHIDDLFNGRGVRAVNYVPRDFEAHNEAGPSPYARFDVEAARAKLRQARQELEAAGAIRPGEPIPPLTLDLPGRDEGARKMGELARKNFGRLGLSVNIELNDWPTLQSKVHNKKTQIYAMGWHADYPDPENFLQNFYTPNIDRGTNNTNYSNAAFDRLFAQAALMMPSPQRTELYVQMIRILNEDCPVLLLSEPVGYFLAYDWLHNVKPHPIGYGFSKYRRLDVERRRQQGGGH